MHLAPIPARPLATISDRRTNWILSDAGPIGDPAGYSTADAAIRALSELTSGADVAACAILRISGRFCGQRLNAVAYVAGHPGTETPVAPFTHLELLSATDPQRLRSLSWRVDRTGAHLPIDDRLCAIVDGAALLRIRLR